MSQPAKQETTVDSHLQKADALLAALDSMDAENALRRLEEVGSQFARETRAQMRELQDKARLGVALELAMKQAQKQGRSTEGRRTLQTLLTAAAFDEDNDGEAPSASGKHRAAALGIHERAFYLAVRRAKELMSDLHPAEAIRTRGVYWFWPKARRNDAASEELVRLRVRYSGKQMGE
ncbi:unnamed protein product [Ectocarpus sp. 13 AM-2016]